MHTQCHNVHIISIIIRNSSSSGADDARQVMEELDPDDEAEDLLALLDSAWESQDLRGNGGLMNELSTGRWWRFQIFWWFSPRFSGEINKSILTNIFSNEVGSTTNY